MSFRTYILKGHEAVPEEDCMKFGEFMEDIDNRRVGLTEIGNIRVSTVFLGIDHNFGLPGKPVLFEAKPILFETMVFGGELDEIQVRYSTWEEAEKGHKEMVELVKKVSKRKRRGGGE